jgi:hypothetical protein
MAYTLGWVATDWSIDASSNIRYIGDAHGGTSPSYVTVIDFHRALQDFADDAAAAGDDLLDISKLTPSDRSTDNIITMLNSFNIDDTAAEHLYDGSIIQASGAEIYDGVVNFGNAKYIILHQDGAILNDTTDFWNSYSADGVAENKFPPNNTQPGVSHNFLVKVRTAGADIDGRQILGLTRELNNTYAEFQIQGTARGNNVLALSESTDLNNPTVEATIATYDKFQNSVEGYDNANDVDPTVDPEEYYSRWDIVAGTTPTTTTINDLYEYTKWVQRRGTAETLYGMGGDLFRGVTHEISYNTLAGGTFADSTLLQIGSVVGAAYILADNGTDTMWIQLIKLSTTLSGTLTQGAVTATLGTATARPVSPAFIGQSTGSAIIGAYGLGIASNDLQAADTLTDLGAQLIKPPNNVTFTVSGLTSGEDRVLVAPRTGGVINKSQLTLNTTVNGAAVTSLVFTAGVPTDIEVPGTLRLVNDSDYEVLLNYTAVSQTTVPRDTLTISAYNFSGTQENDAATAGNGAYITYIDKLAGSTTESFTVVYSTDRDLFIRVRDGGGTPVKTAENNAVTLGDTSQTVAVSPVSDE